MLRTLCVLSNLRVQFWDAQDLLNPKAGDLALRENAEDGVHVPGMREVLVTRLEDCLELLKVGERNRSPPPPPPPCFLEMQWGDWCKACEAFLLACLRCFRILTRQSCMFAPSSLGLNVMASCNRCLYGSR